MRVEKLRSSSWLALLLALVLSGVRADALPAQSRQLILVVTPSWDAVQGTLHAYERRGTEWSARLDAPVSIGSKGSAWGVGLHESQEGPQKREGDGRSPAGMFSIGTAFGYASSLPSGIAYQAMSEFDYCIDVDESPHYNRIVDARAVGREAVEKSTEPMRRDIHVKGDQRYKVGFVIAHNPQGLASKGSCIFAHLWGHPGQTTAGCTAMNEQVMRELVAWLNGEAAPIFILLPQAEYERLAPQWELPRGVRAPQ